MFTQIFQPYKIKKLFLLIAIICTFINLQSKIHQNYTSKDGKLRSFLEISSSCFTSKPSLELLKMQ